MLPSAHAEENGSHMPPREPAVFLAQRIAPFTQHRRFRAYYLAICWIESARYDFERFLPLQKKAGCRKAAFGYFSRNYQKY
jgi:hypothetical protein